MGNFAVVRDRSSRSLEKVGRFRMEGDAVVIHLDGIGTFQVGRAQVIPVLLRLGEEVIRDRDGGVVGVMSVSGSGRGVKMVLEEKEKKGAVFGVILM